MLNAQRALDKNTYLMGKTLQVSASTGNLGHRSLRLFSYVAPPVVVRYHVFGLEGQNNEGLLGQYRYNLRFQQNVMGESKGYLASTRQEKTKTRRQQQICTSSGP